MKQAGFLNVITELIAWPVVETETGVTLGVVTDVAVHPTSGDLTGLIMLTNQGRQAALATDHFQFDEQERKICAPLDALLIGAEIELYLHESVTVCGDLLACEVVTREGKLLGQISEAYVAVAPPPQLIYRITEPGLLRLLGRSFYLRANAPYFFSQVERRLIVPAMSVAELSCRSLLQAANKSAQPTLAREQSEGIKHVLH